MTARMATAAVAARRPLAATRWAPPPTAPRRTWSRPRWQQVRVILDAFVKAQNTQKLVVFTLHPTPFHSRFPVPPRPVHGDADVPGLHGLRDLLRLRLRLAPSALPVVLLAALLLRLLAVPQLLPLDDLGRTVGGGATGKLSLMTLCVI